MKVVAVGYTGTGSSALVHLLKEYDNCYDISSKNYEHYILHAPHCLFDLEDVLLNNNSMYRSDAAINLFYKEMKHLNDYDYGSFGGYKKKFGNRFMEIVEEFIKSLILYSRKGGWPPFDYKPIFKYEYVLKDIIKFCLGRKISKFGYRINGIGDDDITNYAFPTPEEFYYSARRFINNYFDMIGYKTNTVFIFDQLIEPWQLHRINNYFDDDIRFIVFDRDPRDTFLFCKYIWSKRQSYFLMPYNIDEFIKFYSRMYDMEKWIDDRRILRIMFEDLVYHYEATVNVIEEFIGKDLLGKHVLRKKFFNPEESINNTQLYTIDKKWKDEIKGIENSILSKHIYHFPYMHKTTENSVTDPDPDTDN